MFSLGKAKTSPRISQTSSSSRNSQTSKERELDDSRSVTSVCTDLDSLSIRVTRLDAQLEVASRRTAAVEGMVANAEQWLERRLQDYGERLLATWQEHLEACVAKTVAGSLAAVASGNLQSCQLAELDRRQPDLDANDDHGNIVCESMTLTATSSKPQIRKRPAVKRIRRPTTLKAAKSVLDKPPEGQAEASAPSRASESSGLSASHESEDLQSVRQLACHRLPTAPGGGSALRQVKLQCSSRENEITGLLATTPEGVVTRAFAILLTSGSAALTHDHAALLAQLPELGVAVLRCSEENLKGCVNPIADCVATMVKCCHEAQDHPGFPVAVVIDGANVDASLQEALASNIITGVAVLHASRSASSRCSSAAVSSAGVHLLHPERLEDLTAWLSQLPQLARIS